MAKFTKLLRLKQGKNQETGGWLKTRLLIKRTEVYLPKNRRKKHWTWDRCLQRSGSTAKRSSQEEQELHLLQ